VWVRPGLINPVEKGASPPPPTPESKNERRIRRIWEIQN